MAPLHRTPGTRGTLDILERFNARYLERSGDGLVGIQATRALPAFSVAGIEIRDRGEAPTPIRQGIDFYYKERRKIEKQIQRDVYLGLMSPRETVPRAYLPSIQVGPDSIVPPEFTVRGAGPFPYGVFRYMGPHDPRDIDPYELGALWDHVFRTWKPALRAASDAGTAFERIDFAKCSRQYCECDLCYPIRGLDEVT